MDATLGTGGAALLGRAPAGGLDPLPLLGVLLYLWIAFRLLRFRFTLPVAVAAAAGGSLWMSAVEAFGVVRPTALLLLLIAVAVPFRRQPEA
jgi:hypothetical protein